MGNLVNSQNRPKRTLIAYCALAERLQRTNSNMVQALVPFFTEACRDLAGQMFDPIQFAAAIKSHYGIDIPKLAALSFVEQLSKEGVLEVVSGYANSTTYKYSNNIKLVNSDVSAITETEVTNILNQFKTYCNQNADSNAIKLDDLDNEFLNRLLHIDSMRLLSRREQSTTIKKSVSTLQLKPIEDADEATKHALHLDFLVSNFLINLRDTDKNSFEIVSNIAFANMAAEAIACFREPPNEIEDLKNLTILLDTPLILDMLGVNVEYKEYGTELLNLLKQSGSQIAILDHCVVEAENSIRARLHSLRAGTNQITSYSSSSSLSSHLAILSGNVGEIIQSRLSISIEKDPETSILFRRSKETVGTLESNMASKMNWRNADAIEHDRKSVWAMLALRDSGTVQTKICKSEWLLLTRNTPLFKISNDAWKVWLKGSTRYSSSEIDKWAPVCMTDKQFAGYLWARSGGGPSTISQSLLLAHCSSAVRPRADLKTKAYNLVLDMHGQDSAQDIVAILENREAVQMLMLTTLGDPEAITPERLPYIIERVTLAAGEYAAEHARELAKIELESEQLKAAELLNQVIVQNDKDKQILIDERSRQNQLLFDKEQRVFELAQHTKNLNLEIENQRQAEKNRKESILTRGFNAGLREYRACRWLCVALFVLLAVLVSISAANIDILYVTLLTAFLSFAGFWFIPDLLEPYIIKFADKRLKNTINAIDPNINFEDINVNYKNKNYTFN